MIYNRLKKRYILNEAYDFEKEPMEPETIVELLKDMLNDGIVHFVYIRKDGTERDAYGTTSSDIINRRKQPTGRGAGKNYNPLNIRYFDVDSGAWRMCKAENVIKILDDTKERPLLNREIIKEFDNYVEDLLEEGPGKYTVKQVVNGFLYQTDILEDGMIQALTDYLNGNYEIDLYNNTLIGYKVIDDAELEHPISESMLRNIKRKRLLKENYLNKKLYKRRF